MSKPNSVVALCFVSMIFLATAGAAAELPDNFPADIPVAEYMTVVGVTVVRDDMMVNLHAPEQTLSAVAEWFKSGLTETGWKSEGETISERQAILAYSKNGRRCGVTVTNFVFDGSMQRDESIKGITLQISGGDSRAKKKSESASDIAADSL